MCTARHCASPETWSHIRVACPSKLCTPIYTIRCPLESQAQEEQYLKCDATSEDLLQTSRNDFPGTESSSKRSSSQSFEAFLKTSVALFHEELDVRTGSEDACEPTKGRKCPSQEHPRPPRKHLRTYKPRAVSCPARDSRSALPHHRAYHRPTRRGLHDDTDRTTYRQPMWPASSAAPSMSSKH